MIFLGIFLKTNQEEFLLFIMNFLDWNKISKYYQTKRTSIIFRFFMNQSNLFQYKWWDNKITIRYVVDVFFDIMYFFYLLFILLTSFDVLFPDYKRRYNHDRYIVLFVTMFLSTSLVHRMIIISKLLYSSEISINGYLTNYRGLNKTAMLIIIIIPLALIAISIKIGYNNSVKIAKNNISIKEILNLIK